MSAPLSFGVEFEFALAAILDPIDPDIDPSELRCVRFVPIDADIMDCERKSFASRYTVARHMGKTLRAAGFPVDLENTDKGDITKWEISEDFTVEGPDDIYQYFPMEVKSPAYFFTPEALKAIEDVCGLLTSTYCINVNESTGLHVHVGNGRKGYKFDTLRKLVAFLWAFEPQLNTLHPAGRIGQRYCASLREESHYTKNFQIKNKQPPTPLEGVEHFLRCKDIIQLLTGAQHNYYSTTSYNFRYLKARAQGNDWVKPTIEFRQHEGTLNGERVKNWIETVVGIVSFAEDVQPKALTDLLAIVELETWQKMRDGKDQERELSNGPILAEYGYTIIDLLKHMKLWGPAKFYSTRGIFEQKIVVTLPPQLTPVAIKQAQLKKQDIQNQDSDDSEEQQEEGEILEVTPNAAAIPSAASGIPHGDSNTTCLTDSLDEDSSSEHSSPAHAEVIQDVESQEFKDQQKEIKEIMEALQKAAAMPPSISGFLNDPSDATGMIDLFGDDASEELSPKAHPDPDLDVDDDFDFDAAQAGLGGPLLPHEVLVPPAHLPQSQGSDDNSDETFDFLASHDAVVEDAKWRFRLMTASGDSEPAAGSSDPFGPGTAQERPVSADVSPKSPN